MQTLEQVVRQQRVFERLGRAQPALLLLVDELPRFDAAVVEEIVDDAQQVLLNFLNNADIDGKQLPPKRTGRGGSRAAFGMGL